MTLTADDRAALTDLVHRYAACVDDRDVDGAVALFTGDGVLVTARPPRDLDPVDEHVGPAAVRAALGAVGQLLRTAHHVHGAVFDADGDGATGRVACTAHHLAERDGARTDVVWSVRYLDRYRRTTDGWRIARRALHVDVVEVRPVKAVRSAP